MKWSLPVIIILLLPSTTKAAIYISEVAWMGSAESANHEWIELHNNGSNVDVDGWKLTDGMNLSIDLTGTVPSGSNVVLERTSEASAPGSAFLIYTGALVNTGATLKLQRSDGSIEDQVVGGEDWSSVGGDNVTKETAQYTNSGWVTAEATPGKDLSQKSETSESDPTEEKTATSKSSSKSNPTETVKLTLPDVSLKLRVDSQAVGYVNQEIGFSAEPSGIGNTLIDSLTYEWNFGDSLTSNAKSPQHIFKYPGTYLVTVYVRFKRQEQIARHEITILPVEVSLTQNQAGDIQINNDSPYEIDVSGYRLKSTSEFTFPDRSIILPSQTVTIPRQKLGLYLGGQVVLYDNQSLQLTSFPSTKNPPTEQPDTQVYKAPAPQISSISISNDPVEEQPRFGFSDSVGETQVEEISGELVALKEDNLQLAAVSESSSKNSPNWPYLALFVILILSIVAVYIKPEKIEEA